MIERSAANFEWGESTSQVAGSFAIEDLPADLLIIIWHKLTQLRNTYDITKIYGLIIT